ncbi:hypothetical protein ACFE04_021945 [Oxalis oulophora]
MERIPHTVMMDQSRMYNQFIPNSVNPGDGNIQPVLLQPVPLQPVPLQPVPMLDPSGSMYMSMRPGMNLTEIKPVHNYSIQTGEEFALEFMRDRVNPKKPAGDPNYATGYMELKDILGISRGSESGSEISILNSVPKDLRLSSLHENRRPEQQASSHYESQQYRLDYTSSEASDSVSTKMKVLCSFGGKILPRPSDGKLRYVGGETRIVQIRTNISWQELKNKALVIYDETNVIKYQLPGEDLDSLVSVSCDEDLQNMIEECNEILGREKSQKLRMFLFSISDLEDAQFSMGSMDSNSEFQYVVAVNGMDMGSRKGSNLHGLASSSGNNLHELDGPKNETEPVRAVTDLPLTGIQSTQSFIQSPPKAYETYPVYHGQMAHPTSIQQFPLDYSQDSSSYPPSAEIPHFTGDLNYTGDAFAGQQHSGLQPKADLLPPQANVPAWSHHVEMYHPVVSQPHDETLVNHVPVEVVPTVNDAKHLERGNVLSAPDLVNPVRVPHSNGDDSNSASGHIYTDSETNYTDLSIVEPTEPSQRVYRSERIPREQAELLNRLSKSDDSLGSQFFIPHVNTLQEAIKESNENHHTINSVPHDEQSTGTELNTIDDGLVQLQKYKESAETISEMNSKQSEDSLEKDVPQPANDIKDAVNKNGNPKADLESNNTAVSNKASDFPQEDSHISEQNLEENYNNAPVQQDILIDVDERFPRDFLSDMFSKAMLSNNSSGVNPLLNDGSGLSMNMENDDPKHWSYFQKLAQEEIGRKDVSLIDQDHPGFPSAFRETQDGGQRAYGFAPSKTDGIVTDNVDSQVNCNENKTTEGDATVTESMQFDAMLGNLRTEESNYEDGKMETENSGLPMLDSSLDLDISTLQVIMNEDLEELKELGSGTFGTVYHGKWRGSDVAIKRIKKICFTGRSSELERLTVEFWREADILSKLHHPNVVAFYGVVQDGPGGTLATVAEFMVDGSLRHVLLRKDRYLDRRKRLIIAMDAAFGMEYLHSKNIVHFDLKCDNLLVNLKDPSRPICKVADFGLSKIKRNTLVSGGVRGTLPWMAPELLNGGSNKVSEKVDVFSFGIVLWEILTGEEPYANMHYGAIIGGIVNNTLRPTIPSYCDAEWRTLMEQCWAPNPSIRPSFTEIARRLRVMSAAAKPQGGQKATK